MASSTRTARTRLDQTAATRGARTAATVAGAPLGQPPGLLVLDRYRLHRPLGAGGFGTVWMARDERLERDVAVKILARERIVDGRFEREARAAARLGHPGIVTLYEAAVDDDAAYLVSELVRGSTLSQLLESGVLSDRDVLEIGVALADALTHAHAHGVVHRDVKPSNVLVPEHPGPAGQVAKLTDFGVARLIGGDTLTRTGDVVGTAGYMAPEQAEGRDAGATADLYSLALVLYEALSGVNPLAHGEPARRARRLGAHLPPLRRHRRDLPRELGQALDVALRPRERERGSLEELRHALAGSLHQVGDDPGVIEPPWPHRAARREPEPGHQSGRIFHSFDQAPEPQRTDPLPLPWPRRAVGGAAAGVIAAWLVTLLPSAPPVAPAAAGLFGAVLVAALPRLGWIALIAAATTLLALRGRGGAAVLVGLGGLVPIVVLPRHRTSWPLAAAGAALGVVSLAGAWPALAGRARSPWERIGLGAVGWIWTVLGGVLIAHALYTPPWGSSAGSVQHVLSHVLRPGLLAPAVLWGAAAALVPMISRCSLQPRFVLAGVWSAALASGTVTLLHAWEGGIQASSGVVILGAVGAWLALLAPAPIKAWRAAPRSTDTAAGLA